MLGKSILQGSTARAGPAGQGKRALDKFSGTKKWAFAPFFNNLKPDLKGLIAVIWSGISGSNRRPVPWQGTALPTELIPRITHTKLASRRGVEPLLPP